MTPDSKFRWHLILTIVTVAGAVAMLLALLNKNGFWIDELYTLHSIRLSWKEMVFERLHRGHFPGYFAMVRLWYSLWPEAAFETALRSMSVVFYLLAGGSFWLLARRALSAPASLVALALFACNNIALRQASEARMYTVVLFFAVWITRCWFELQQPGSSRNWKMAMPVLSLAAFAVSPTVGLLLGAMVIVSFLNRRDNPTVFYTALVSMAVGLLVFIPGAILHVQTADRLGISSSKPLVFLAHAAALMPGVQIWDDYYNTTLALRILLALALPLTFLAVWRLWKQREVLSPTLRRLGGVVALPYVAITLSYPLVELFDLDIMGPARYFITLMPGAALLGAWAFMSWPRRLAIHAGLTVFLLVSAWSILSVSTEWFRHRMVDGFAKVYQPGDGLIVTAHEIEDGVELYVPGAQVDEAVSRWIMDRDELKKRLSYLGDRENVGLIWYRGNDSPVIEVATELWGPFESNRPEDPHGKLRYYRFRPKQQGGVAGGG